MSITFVSGFFDIGRKTNAPLQKYENYFEWINKLLEIPINLYFFTTQEIHDKLKYTSRDNLKFIILDVMPFSDKLPQIKEIWPTYITNNTEKDTAEFACLTHSKFHLLQRCIQDNPFNSTHYGWIDAGLLKIATHSERLPLLKPSNGIKLLLMNYIGVNEVLMDDFVKTCRYKLAGGLFIGPKDNMIIFTKEIISLAEHDINRGIFGLEQEYMAIMYRKYYDLFDPYYGDFSDLIVNYEKYENNYWILQRIFNTASTLNDTAEILRVLKHC